MPRTAVTAQEGEPTRLLREGAERIREEQGLPAGFDDDVTAAAEAAAAAPRLPDLDRTDLPLLTLDPEGARDLDQAMAIERDGEGYLVHYAIADVSAFVRAGDPVDLEARRRGATCYGSAVKVPLHPPAISEDAGSLLPDQVRPALLWTLRLDPSGRQVDVQLERALVRSQARLSYEEAEQLLDDDNASPVRDTLQLLREVGRLRGDLEVERGAVSLPIPSQEVEVDGDRWSLRMRPAREIEQWNAQISLMTGMAAAEIMLAGGTGIVRTLPPPDPADVERLRRTALGLGLQWPADVDYPAFIAGLDTADPASHAVVVASTILLRGAAYVDFDGELPELRVHAAIAAPYAHATAPLRRLVDRYVLEACLALHEGRPVPDWVREALPELPGTMAGAGQRASRFERAVVDLAECLVLRGRVGETFTGVVVDVGDDETRGRVQVADPAVEASVRAPEGRTVTLGVRVEVTLEAVDVEQGSITFVLV